MIITHQVIAMMKDYRLDDGETESDELDQVSTIACTLSIITWCAQ